MYSHVNLFYVQVFSSAVCFQLQTVFSVSGNRQNILPA